MSTKEKWSKKFTVYVTQQNTNTHTNQHSVHVSVCVGTGAHTQIQHGAHAPSSLAWFIT